MNSSLDADASILRTLRDGTSALVPAWCPFSDKEKMIYRRLAAKVFAAAKQGMAHVKPRRDGLVAIDAERLKRVYDDLVLGAGATVLFHTMLSAVQTDCHRLAG